jgi:hypothetical protein
MTQRGERVLEQDTIVILLKIKQQQDIGLAECGLLELKYLI